MIREATDQEDWQENSGQHTSNKANWRKNHRVPKVELSADLESEFWRFYSPVKSDCWKTIHS